LTRVTATIGVFGKIPAAADFVAVDAAGPTGAALQEWLQRENDHLLGKRLAFPPTPIRFLYRDPQAQGTMVGALAPSRDQVGRTFPLSIVARLEPSTAMRFPAIPAAYAQFLDGAAAVLADAAQLTAATLAERARALPLPGASEIDEAEQWSRQALEATPGLVILEALFGPLGGGVQYHGIHMFRTGCAQVTGRDPGTATIILECPASDDVQVDFWLSLAQGLLRWTAVPPSLLWTDTASPDSRLLVALGSPPPGVLHYLADPAVVADRLWPMRTASAASIEAGRGALTYAQRSVLEPPAPTAAAILEGLLR
jgi:type VI secretion system protein ImpM